MCNATMLNVIKLARAADVSKTSKIIWRLKKDVKHFTLWNI